MEALYGDERADSGKLKAAAQKTLHSRLQQQVQKQGILAELQRDYAWLKASWGGESEYDEWFASHVNNAKLNSVAAYYDFVPGFQRLLEINGGDLEKFYLAAERCSKLPKELRHQQLQTLAADAGPDSKLTSLRPPASP